MLEDQKNNFEGISLTGKSGTQIPYGLNRYVLLIIYCLFCALTTSAIQQNICIRLILVKLGAYEWLCDPNSIENLPTGAKCRLQDNRLTACWTAGIMAPNLVLSVLGFGRLFDYIGPKYTGITGQVMFMLGIIIFCISNVNLPLYPLGFILIGIPQGPIFNSVISIANLFPNHSNQIISILSTMGDVSASVFYCIYYFHEYSKANLKGILIFYALFVCGLLTLVAIFLIPKISFERYIDNNENIMDNESHRLSIETDNSSESNKSSIKPYLHSASFKTQLLSSYFLLLLPYFTLTVFRSDSIKACLDAFLLESNSENINEVRYHMSIFSTIQCFSFIFSLANGFVMDLIGVAKGLILQNTFGVIVSLFFMFPNGNTRVLSFFIYFAYSSCIYATAYCYLAKCFGFSNINFLMALITGPVGFLYIVIPLMYSHLDSSNYFYFHMFYVGISLLMYITPINMLVNKPENYKPKVLIGYIKSVLIPVNNDRNNNDTEQCNECLEK
ncbi:hypothetical protein ACR3K2_26370 [Cryptosporidium serpentis]